VSVQVFAGSVKNPDGTIYTGKLLLLMVPLERTPLALPAEFEPEMVIAVQPGGLRFNPPAQITFPNTNNYPEGTILDLWSLNPDTGQFYKTGTVKVQGGMITTITGGMSLSAWHFVIPRPGLISSAKNYLANLLRKGCAQKGSSEANFSNGNLNEEHSLPAVRFLGTDFAPKLVYNSATAYPNKIIEADMDYSATIKPNGIQDKILINGVETPLTLRAVPAVADTKFHLAKTADLSLFPTGIAKAAYRVRSRANAPK
jgi:hypothetical protein